MYKSMAVPNPNTTPIPPISATLGRPGLFMSKPRMPISGALRIHFLVVSQVARKLITMPIIITSSISSKGIH